MRSICRAKDWDTICPASLPPGTRGDTRPLAGTKLAPPSHITDSLSACWPAPPNQAMGCAEVRAVLRMWPRQGKGSGGSLKPALPRCSQDWAKAQSDPQNSTHPGMRHGVLGDSAMRNPEQDAQAFHGVQATQCVGGTEHFHVIAKWAMERGGTAPESQQQVVTVPKTSRGCHWDTRTLRRCPKCICRENIPGPPHLGFAWPFHDIPQKDAGRQRPTPARGPAPDWALDTQLTSEIVLKTGVCVTEPARNQHRESCCPPATRVQAYNLSYCGG